MFHILWGDCVSGGGAGYLLIKRSVVGFPHASESNSAPATCPMILRHAARYGVTNLSKSSRATNTTTPSVNV